MINVLIIQRRMAEYRLSLFELMRKRLSEENVLLQVVSGTPSPEEFDRNDGGLLSWGLEIPCHYFHFKRFRLTFQPIPNTFLSKQDLIIITHENLLLYNYWMLLWRRFVNKRIAFWGHGTNFQRNKKNSLSEKVKSWTANQVDWWFAYTSLSVDKIISNGFPENRITCLNNTVDINELRNLRKSISLSEIKSLRKTLGICGRHVGVFIGSLHKDKRLNFLFEAADELRKRLPDFELIIIGDGPLRDMVRNKVANRLWSRWVGARHGLEKVLYLSLGKVMLNPGLVGLNILDSFAMGLPMVTTDCRIHSPEIDYLESGINGLMANNDCHSFVDGVLSLFSNTPLRDTMASACENDAGRYSLEKMVENFSDGILKTLHTG
ncbi:glycosyltransferase family 4 protein [Thermodesulfobacteriota bacterium]